MLVKIYGQSSESEKRYSPAECIGAVKYRVEGIPIPSTSARHLPSGKISMFGCTLAGLRG
jgi:hypothetical protein